MMLLHLFLLITFVLPNTSSCIEVHRKIGLILPLSMTAVNT